MLSQGQGVRKEAGEARRWYRAAAEQGHRDAQFNLGGMYATGTGIAQDYVQAFKWLALAAAAGDADSARARDRVAARLAPRQLQEAQALAAAWTAKTR